MLAHGPQETSNENRTGYHRGGWWTRLEAAIWLLALIIVITAGILVATNVVGPWALIISAAFVVVVSLHRYRVETKQTSETPTFVKNSHPQPRSNPIKNSGTCQSRLRTPLGLAIWLAALVASVSSAILALTHVIGSMVPYIANGVLLIAIGVCYWLDTERAGRSTGD